MFRELSRSISLAQKTIVRNSGLFWYFNCGTIIGLLEDEKLLQKISQILLFYGDHIWSRFISWRKLKIISAPISFFWKNPKPGLRSIHYLTGDYQCGYHSIFWGFC